MTLLTLVSRDSHLHYLYLKILWYFHCTRSLFLQSFLIHPPFWTLSIASFTFAKEFHITHCNNNSPIFHAVDSYKNYLFIASDTVKFIVSMSSYKIIYYLPFDELDFLIIFLDVEDLNIKEYDY